MPAAAARVLSFPRPKKKGTRTIAPRLANGHSRESLYAALPPAAKKALRKRAKAEGESMNWVMEQALIKALFLPMPDYKLPKAES